METCRQFLNDLQFLVPIAITHCHRTFQTMAPKLRPGKGARATILTRYIKPKQPLPSSDKKHRSEVILEERFFDHENKPVYKFKYALAVYRKSPELHAKAHWIHLVQEGHHQHLFDGPGEPLLDGKDKEPKIKCGHSRARQPVRIQR